MKNAFLSYPYRDSRSRYIMTEIVTSILREFQFEVWDASYSLKTGDSIYNAIVGGIRRADLIISDVSITNANVSYELGIAHAWGIPSLLLTRDIDRVPFDVATYYQMITYGDSFDAHERFKHSFVNSLKGFIEKPESKLPRIFDRYLTRSNSVRFELRDAGPPNVQIFNLIAELTEAISDIEDIGDSHLEEIRVGSLGVWISANIETVVALAEKIIFFVPETRKKWIEGTKLKEEAEVIRAQKAKIDAETRSIEDENHRKNVDKFLDVVDRLGKQGEFRVTFGERLEITSTIDRPLQLDKPKNQSGKDARNGRS